jgi:hypothetical protein
MSNSVARTQPHTQRTAIHHAGWTPCTRNGLRTPPFPVHSRNAVPNNPLHSTDATAPYCALYSATSFGGVSVYGCVNAAPFNRSLLARSDLAASTSRTPPTTGATVVTLTVDSSPKESNSASLSSESGSFTSSGTTSTSPATNDSSVAAKDSSNTGAIAGGVVGGIAVLGLGALAFFFIRRRSKNPAQPAGVQQMPPPGPQPPMGYAPVPPTDYNQQQLYPQQTYYAEAPSPAQSPSPVPFYAAQEGYYGPHVAKAPVVPPVELSADEVGHPVELSASPTR